MLIPSVFKRLFFWFCCCCWSRRYVFFLLLRIQNYEIYYEEFWQYVQNKRKHWTFSRYEYMCTTNIQLNTPCILLWSSADLETQLMQLKHCDGEESITKMPYKEMESLVVIFCFMSRSALHTVHFLFPC